jgi:hypothetical protein
MHLDLCSHFITHFFHCDQPDRPQAGGLTGAQGRSNRRHLSGLTGPLEAGMVCSGLADTEPTEPYSVGLTGHLTSV